MSAFFRNPIYGPYAVTGTLITLAHGSLGVAGQTVETGTGARRPVPELFALSQATDNPPPPTVYSSDADTLPALHHGDLVEAAFEQLSYGLFTLTGLVIDAPVGDVLVLGGWFLTERTLGRAPARRLRGVTVLRSRTEHNSPVPNRIHRWPEPTPED
ncbi:hypothetical protein [Nocardia sp. NBC_01388]|uniref:hypothetical protein n=1 Tax=Nocardia sp. NBC_01388 TaxID=2903596 RepID=UPI00386ECA5B